MSNLVAKLKIDNRLKLRFFAFFVLAGLIIILLLSSFFYLYVTETMTSSYQEQAKKAIERFEIRLQSFITNEQEILLTYHNTLGTEFPEKLIQVVDDNPRYYESFILDRYGVVQYASDPLRIGYNYGEKDIYKLAIEAREPLFNTRFHPFENNLLIDLIIPINRLDDELDYIAVHQLNPGWFEDELGKEHVDEEGDIIMFDDIGIIYLRIQDSAGQHEEEDTNKPISLFDYDFSYDRMQESHEGIQSFTSGDYLVTYKTMAGGLGLVANQRSMVAIGEQISYIIKLILLLALLGLLLYAFLGVLLANKTMKPIHDLSRQVKETLGGRQPAITVQENSELTALVDAFNQSWQKNRDFQKRILQEKSNAEIAQRKAEEANKAKSQFLTNMSHEIRTPMNSIISLSHLAIKKTLDNQEASRYLREIQDSGKKLLVIINDILDYSKIEAGSLDLEKKAFSLREAIDKITIRFAYQAEQKGLEFIKDISEQLPSYVVGDSLRISQALVNVLANAIKFTDSGSITLAVDLQEQEQERVKIIFSIKDTGIGIEEEKQALLFDAFSQADGSTTRKYGGTGLGLTITKKLVEMMGGRIWFESEPRKGSIFYFTVEASMITEAQGIVSESKELDFGDKEDFLGLPAIDALPKEDESKETKDSPDLEEYNGNLSELLDTIKQLLAVDYFVEDQLLQQVERVLPQNQLILAKLAKLKIALNDFDYEQARTILAEIEDIH